ncbi:MAG: rod shape-determining protein MreC [Desulfobacterales bacterium]|nr:rod shape-determining protein MreC [Desulfobacterales bacterium]
MFSKKSMVVAGAIILIALNALVFSIDMIRSSAVYEAAARAAIFFVAPVQEVLHSSVEFVDDLWEHYFWLVSVGYENERLQKELAQAKQANHKCREVALANERLRELVRLKQQRSFEYLAAEVIARDPSPWYRTIVINKGTADGVRAQNPVLTAKGIVGHVLHATADHAKVLLIVDRNSSVDAMIQRSRARGIARGADNGKCLFDYTLRKKEVRIDDIVISSGFDQLYPKGFRIGRVSKVVRRNAGLFQDVEITPFIDFKTLEEVMVLLNPPDYEVAEN